MPIHEYGCTTCGHEFETLVRTPADAPQCPSCASTDLARRLSVPAAAQGGSSSLSLAQAGPMPGGGCGRPACAGGFCAGGGE